MSIRWAIVTDARAIAAIHIASWRPAYRGLLPDTTLAELTIEGRQRDWQEWLAEEGERRHTLVAECDGKVEAFCTLEPVDARREPPRGSVL